MYDVIIFTDLTESHSGDFPAPVKSLGAYQIASVLRENGYKVKVVDYFIWLLENYKEELFQWIDENIRGVKIVGFSTTFLSPFNVSNRNRKSRAALGVSITKRDARPEFGELLNILDKWKKKQSMKILLGGQGVQTGPMIKIYNKEIDHWFRGLSEDVLLKFLKNWKWDGHPRIIEDSSLTPAHYDFHNMSPTFDKSDIVYSYESLPMEISRGCRFKCKFCSYPLIGRKPSPEWNRSEESIYNELKYNYDNFGVTNYQFMDDTFNETTEKLKVVQRAIERTGIQINFWAYIRMELLNAFPEQISILRDMGQKAAFFGVESLHDPSAKSIGKGLGREKIRNLLERVKESWGKDSVLHGSFIMGLPFETPQTAEEWVQILIKREIALDSCSYNALTLATQNHGKGLPSHSKMWLSEFDINAEQYGYERGRGIYQWRNEHWDFKIAKRFAEESIKRIKRAAPGPLQHDILPHIMPMMNLGFTRDEIYNIKSIDFRDEIKKRRLKLLEDYKERILA